MRSAILNVSFFSALLAATLPFTSLEARPGLDEQTLAVIENSDLIHEDLKGHLLTFASKIDVSSEGVFELRFRVPTTKPRKDKPWLDSQLNRFLFLTSTIEESYGMRIIPAFFSQKAFEKAMSSVSDEQESLLMTVHVLGSIDSILNAERHRQFSRSWTAKWITSIGFSKKLSPFVAPDGDELTYEKPLRTSDLISRSVIQTLKKVVLINDDKTSTRDLLSLWQLHKTLDQNLQDFLGLKFKAPVTVVSRDHKEHEERVDFVFDRSIAVSPNLQINLGLPEGGFRTLTFRTRLDRQYTLERAGPDTLAFRFQAFAEGSDPDSPKRVPYRMAFIRSMEPSDDGKSPRPVITLVVQEYTPDGTEVTEKSVRTFAVDALKISRPQKATRQ